MVVGSVPWGERSGSRRLPRSRSCGLVALAVAVVAGAGWLLRPAATRRFSGLRPFPRAAPSTAATGPDPPRPRRGLSATDARAAPGIAPAARGAAAAARARPPRAPPPSAAAPEVVPRRRRRPSSASTRSARATGKPVALINDRLVREGDSFDGVRVLRIGEAEVEVEVRGQRRVLRF